jgi:hypothetical protein
LREDVQVRQRVAELAKGFRAGALDFKGFFASLPAEVETLDDPEVEELLDLLEHEPARGGFWGAPDAEADANALAIDRLIRALAA